MTPTELLDELIPGTEGCNKAKSDGSIWSRRGRGQKAGYKVKWRKLKRYPSKNGYPTVTVKINGKWRKCLVHVLVLFAFKGSPPKGMCARHFPDRDKNNCSINNLSWSTYKQNCRDKIIHGTHQTGENHGRHKLTWKVVRLIKRLLKLNRYSQSEIANMIGVHKTTISLIHNCRIWRE